jgi:Flp pilus assembly protein TadD
VFYPTRGVLAFYDRTEQKLRPLPGADDPRFVHTSAFWSPDGKYLISPYTRLMLTHIDANGNDTPAIIVDNTTAANRAVNIHEFLNLPADGLEKIDPQATNFIRYFNQAYELMENNRVTEAVPLLKQAVDSDPSDAIGHYALATALAQSGKEHPAVEEYRKALALNPTPPAAWYDHLAVLQAQTGDLPGAVENLRLSLTIDPKDAGTETGQAQEGFEHLRKAISMAPDFPDPHNHLGWELAKTGRFDEAIDDSKKPLRSARARWSIASTLATSRPFVETYWRALTTSLAVPPKRLTLNSMHLISPSGITTNRSRSTCGQISSTTSAGPPRRRRTKQTRDASSNVIACNFTSALRLRGQNHP